MVKPHRETLYKRPLVNKVGLLNQGGSEEVETSTEGEGNYSKVLEREVLSEELSLQQFFENRQVPHSTTVELSMRRTWVVLYEVLGAKQYPPDEQSGQAVT